MYKEWSTVCIPSSHCQQGQTDRQKDGWKEKWEEGQMKNDRNPYLLLPSESSVPEIKKD